VQIAPVDHVTYKITAIYFIWHAVFGILLPLFSNLKAKSLYDTWAR